ncbi:class E sortase [Actinomadura rubrobrunea]|uniref:Class E sortase n=1 Tax=Actinomadura rubrobrunea TaxID=115335 RepID=A0A9W6UUJ5_9ACTN|nr:class E sortase [Actinomadura rubrobrunea]GLW64696.1 class E sortase [Actinomadura rubrobrunea]
MRTLIRGLGELCITAGLVLLLFVAYELWGTGRYTREQQDRLGKELTKAWQAPAVTTEKVKLGRGLALIRIPKLGRDYRYVIVEGVTRADLRKGPGHYPGTAMPGEVGNFVVSGHRTTYSAPFNRIGELRRGDRILIDTRRRQFVYQVTGRRIVEPDDVEVIAPVPNHPRRRPTERLITLTTCHPKYSAAERLIVHGRLVETRERVAAPTSPQAAD